MLALVFRARAFRPSLSPAPNPRPLASSLGCPHLDAHVVLFLELCINNHGHRNLDAESRARYERLYRLPRSLDAGRGRLRGSRRSSPRPGGAGPGLAPRAPNGRSRGDRFRRASPRAHTPSSHRLDALLLSRRAPGSVAFRGAFRDSSSRMNESGSYRFRDRTSPSKPWRVGASSRNSAAEASALREASRNRPT